MFVGAFRNMTKRKSSLGRCSFNAKRMKLNRINETSSAHRARLETLRKNVKQSRYNETPSDHCARLETMRKNVQQSRDNETVVQRQKKLAEVRIRAYNRRKVQWSELKFAAFHYDSSIDYMYV